MKFHNPRFFNCGELHLPFLVFHALDGAFEEKLPHRFYVGSVVKWLTFTSSTLKVARYSFSRSIPPKFERKLRRHKQGFGKIDTTVVLNKDENLL